MSHLNVDNTSTLVEVKGLSDPKQQVGSPSSTTPPVTTPLVQTGSFASTLTLTNEGATPVACPTVGEEIQPVSSTTIPVIASASSAATPTPSMDGSTAPPIHSDPLVPHPAVLPDTPAPVQDHTEEKAQRVRAEKEARRRARKEKAKAVAWKVGEWIANAGAHAVFSACIGDVFDF